MADPNPLAGMPLAESLANNMNESLQWMSRMWSSAAAGSTPSTLPSGLPSMMVPTLDPKELDKRISDLRSVQHWLDMNRALLHTTIQTLEMQRNAIVALQSMAASAQAGAAAAQRVPEAPPAGAAAAPPGGDSAAGAPPLPFNPAQWWNALGEQFARVAASAVTEPGAAPDPSADPAAAPPTPDSRGAGQGPPSSGARPGRKGPGQ
jgi:hypothetical protein